MCAFLKILVKIPSNQSPLVGLTWPYSSEGSLHTPGKICSIFTEVFVPLSLGPLAFRAETTVCRAAVFPVAGCPAKRTAAAGMAEIGLRRKGKGGSAVCRLH